jgi:hypothetical protein
MFRLFQVDPETGALHVNVGAIRRHAHSDALLAALDAFRSNNLYELWRTLFRLPESDERAHVVAFVSQLFHEMRHVVDLLLTPYGFHRIRMGFEFYEALPQFLATDERKIFPFSSWMDPGMRELLGGDGTEKSLSYSVAHMSQNRRSLIEADNRRFKHETGTMMAFGGDAILEALAFGWQIEWLQHPAFATDEMRTLMPYAFPDGRSGSEARDELTQFDMTYRWHYRLMGTLSQEQTPAAATLMYTILFAALCGSLARDAKPLDLSWDEEGPKRVSRVGARDVSDRLPAMRFRDLLGWFGNYIERGGRIPEKPLDSWELVNEASSLLWQRTIMAEIGEDIVADERLLAAWRPLSSEEVLPLRPCAAFADLVELRKALFTALSTDPEKILRPLALAKLIDELPAIPLCFVYPEGTGDGLPGTERLIEKLVALPPGLKPQSAAEPRGKSKEPGADTVLAMEMLYSSWQLKGASAAESGIKGREAWPTLLGHFSPTYKLALYGHRYRSMLELDLMRARESLNYGQSDVRWDEYFLDVEDLSASWEYFHFYGLETAECDVCSQVTDANGSIIASSATMRSSEAFIENRRQHGEHAIFFLEKDWSIWLVCSDCRRRYL